MNQVVLIGNLTKDIETRQTPNGKSVATLSIAVKRPHSEETDFFNVVVWDKKAEICAKYLKKGSKVGIVGYLYNNSYEANDGTKRTITQINAIEVEFLTPKQVEEQPEVIPAKRPPLEEIEDNSFPF